MVHRKCLVTQIKGNASEFKATYCHDIRDSIFWLYKAFQVQANVNLHLNQESKPLFSVEYVNIVVSCVQQ